MIFFKSKINIKKVFNIEDNDKNVVEAIKKIGEWSNVQEPVSYSDKIAIYSYLYGHMNNLKGSDLTGFVSIVSGLLSDMSASFGVHDDKKYDDIETKAIDLLNTLNSLDSISEDDKATAVIDLILTNYKNYDNEQLVKKTVLLSKKNIKQVDKFQGLNFSDKLRNVINDYFDKN